MKKQSKKREDWEYQTFIPTTKIKIELLQQIWKNGKEWEVLNSNLSDRLQAKLLKNAFETNYVHPHAK